MSQGEVKDIKIEGADELIRSALETDSESSASLSAVDQEEQTFTREDLGAIQEMSETFDDFIAAEQQKEAEEPNPSPSTKEQMDSVQDNQVSPDPEEMKNTSEQETIEAEEDDEPEKNEYYERLVRVSADFDNYRKRTLKEKSELRKYGHEFVLRDLLEVLDNFERALQAGGDADSLRLGIEMVYKQLLETFEKHGAKRFESKGVPFDYKVHEALSVQETNDLPPDHVLEEFQVGYMLHDKLLRPARVVVSKPKSVPDTPPEDPEESHETIEHPEIIIEENEISSGE